MIAVFKNFFIINARWCPFHFLAFLIVVIPACRSKEDAAIRIVWIDNKASAIYIPKTLFKNIPHDSIGNFFRVSLAQAKDSTAILGEVKVQNNIIFEPLLPFTRGSGYEVFYKNKKISEFDVPAPDANNTPQLNAIYPLQDTLPSNLLKIYLAFSHPMSEGHSDQYLSLVKNNKDTLNNEFLNLQPELWNEDRTVITIWFDPGRIKRDLQPNLRLGAPLKPAENYRLIVSKNWKDALGVPLKNDVTKYFVTGGRDSLSSNVDHWKISTPEKNTQDALVIDTDEALDHYLFAESLTVTDDRKNIIKGTFELFNRDQGCRFIPGSSWSAGIYSLVIESRLEDLAGNNLNRPFDRDITQTKQPLTKDSYELNFKIK